MYIYLILLKSVQIEKMFFFFLNKNDFYNTKVTNLILKFFLNYCAFYKNEFETRFFRLARLRENLKLTYMSILEGFRNILNCKLDFTDFNYGFRHSGYRFIMGFMLITTRRVY